MTFAKNHDGRRKLFSYAKQYNNFKEISSSDIDRIRKKIKIMYGDKKNNFSDAIEFLAGRNIHLVFPTYDEKIVFLILAGDPDFLIHDMYLDSKIILEATISQADDEEKPLLIEKRKRQITDFINRVKSRFGFFDMKILTYESALRKIIEKDKLVFDVKYDATTKMMERAQQVHNFDSITDDDIERLKLSGDRWLVETPDTNDYNSLAYNLLTNPKLFNIKTIDEQVLLFIMLFDPELRMLKIYEEESRIPYTEARCIEEIGFFDLNLIRLERKYHDKFLPDMKLSEWDK